MNCFFDTNVLVYVHDPRDARKQTIAHRLFAEHFAAGTFVVSTQVLQEFCAAVEKRKLLRPERALEVAREIAGDDVRPTSADMVLRGVALSHRHRLSIWDGLIVQAALDAGCATLFSEDLQHGQRFGTLQVVNPFAPEAHDAPPPAYRTRRRSGT